MNDIFSNLFGGDGGRNQFGGFSGSSRSQSGFGFRSSPKSFKPINSKIFKKEIAEQGMTWLLLSYTPSLRGSHYYESIIQEVADSFQGALKVHIFAYLNALYHVILYYSFTCALLCSYR